jgi:hypothetical protein
MTRPFLEFREEAKDEAAQRFVDWLGAHTIDSARGMQEQEALDDPSDRLWLGRLAPDAIAAASGRDARLERLEPCEVGFRLLPKHQGPWDMKLTVELRLWRKEKDKSWHKIALPAKTIDIHAMPGASRRYAQHELTSHLREASGCIGFSAEFQCGSSTDWRGREVVSITLVNTSDKDGCKPFDSRFYELVVHLNGVETDPFELEALEESFRFDRLVPGYGINCGIRHDQGQFTTIDTPSFDRARPDFWGADTDAPDLHFASVARDPLSPAHVLLNAHTEWGARHWGSLALDQRAKAEEWGEEMRAAAETAAKAFHEENSRIRRGVDVLAFDKQLARAFCLMNEAMVIVGERKGYLEWRPFQFGFLLSNLVSLVDDAEEDIADIVWFATGGGKTETYLGLLVTAAFYDRLRGKTAGITAWSRFPLRLLSLQQMQRFADVMAAAELVRRYHRVEGSAYSVGFLVGDDSTPNKWRRRDQDKSSRYDPDDKSLVERFRMLQACPFCGNPALKMAFNTGRWTYEHRCGAEGCEWPEKALPFHIVDEEVYRFLPTVVVGTLDKAAMIGLQQAMRGFVAAPRGVCPKAGHGFTYNPSGTSPCGCLVPDCVEQPKPLPFSKEMFAPTFRLQDELHLLRDSLGAVDGHYEAALDGLQKELTGRRAKILASSATLSGYEKQSEVLYRRRARVFPQPSPTPREGFWSRPSKKRMRRFVALAPRGATIEFAVDRLMSELQIGVRRLWREPAAVCQELGIDERFADFLLEQYGTTVVYGNTLRDLDAVSRSATTQLVGVEGKVRSVTLTGRVQFDQISGILDDLQKLDAKRPFEERIHLITASSMMSHGVDVDRLNIMIVLGLPLTTAEFIQATARVGRRWPALVLVVHKMGRERDAGVYRLFEKFVEQGDRFVEPIPITKRSRRVLHRTIPGIEGARLLHVHAAAARERFTTVGHLRQKIARGEFVGEREAEAIISYLDFDDTTEAEHQADVRNALELYGERVQRPTTEGKDWFVKVWPKNRQPMMSLRDVEDQVPVYLRRD